MYYVCEKLPEEGRGVMQFWSNLRLASRFMLIVGSGLITLVFAAVFGISEYETEALDSRLYNLSLNEMTSLHALILNASRDAGIV